MCIYAIYKYFHLNISNYWWQQIFHILNFWNEYLDLYYEVLAAFSGKESICRFRRHKRGRFNPWVGKIPWRREWQPTPVLLPGKFHRQRSLWARIREVAKSQTRQHTRTVSYMKYLYCTAQSAQSKSRAGIINLLREQSFWGLGNSLKISTALKVLGRMRLHS